MKNSKIISLLFLCSILLIFSLNSFKAKPQQTCSSDYIKKTNLYVNAGKILLGGELPGYENCVNRFDNTVAREEIITNAYSLLGSYYESNQRDDLARYYRSMVAKENRKR